MIAGLLKESDRYADLHPDLTVGFDAIKNLNSAAEVGEYRINDQVTLIVSSYETTLDRPNKYEAHRKMIDIQYVVSGQECVDWSPLKGMTLKNAYDESRDRAFWVEPFQPTSVIIGDGVFAVFFPEDAHRPCLPGPAGSKQILKATVKIEDWK